MASKSIISTAVTPSPKTPICQIPPDPPFAKGGLGVFLRRGAAAPHGVFPGSFLTSVETGLK